MKYYSLESLKNNNLFCLKINATIMIIINFLYLLFLKIKI